ncbi:hypothetical protein BGW42_008661 [Actinomortierella wolfii]|nr:hypothetical protein BGW42_008661 [Actinomortierella wolfii]
MNTSKAVAQLYIRTRVSELFASMTVHEAIKRLLHSGRGHTKHSYERVFYGLIYADEGLDGQVRILGLISAFDLLNAFMHPLVVERGPHNVLVCDVLTPNNIVATWTSDNTYPTDFECMVGHNPEPIVDAFGFTQLIAEDGHNLGYLHADAIHWQTEAERRTAIIQKWFPGIDVDMTTQQSYEGLLSILKKSICTDTAERSDANKSITFVRENDTIDVVIQTIHIDSAPLVVVLDEHENDITGIVRLHDLLAMIVYATPASLVMQPVGEWAIPAIGDNCAQKFQWVVRFMLKFEDDFNRLTPIKACKMIHASVMTDTLNKKISTSSLFTMSLTSLFILTAVTCGAAIAAGDKPDLSFVVNTLDLRLQNIKDGVRRTFCHGSSTDYERQAQSNDFPSSTPNEPIEPLLLDIPELRLLPPPLPPPSPVTITRTSYPCSTLGYAKVTSLNEALLQQNNAFLHFLLPLCKVLSGPSALAFTLVGLGGRYFMRRYRQEQEEQDHRQQDLLEAAAQAEHDRMYQFNYPTVVAIASDDTVAPYDINPYTQPIGPSFPFRIQLPHEQLVTQATIYNNITADDMADFLAQPLLAAPSPVFRTIMYSDVPASNVGYYRLMDKLRDTTYGQLLYVFQLPDAASDSHNNVLHDQAITSVTSTPVDGSTGSHKKDDLDDTDDDYSIVSELIVSSLGSSGTKGDYTNNGDNVNDYQDACNGQQGHDISARMPPQWFLVPVYTDYRGQDTLLSTWGMVKAVREATVQGERHVNLRFRIVTEAQLTEGRNTMGVRWTYKKAFEH